jgi:hypothetical protein
MAWLINLAGSGYPLLIGLDSKVANHINGSEMLSTVVWKSRAYLPRKGAPLSYMRSVPTSTRSSCLYGSCPRIFEGVDHCSTNSWFDGGYIPRLARFIRKLTYVRHWHLHMASWAVSIKPLKDWSITRLCCDVRQELVDESEVSRCVVIR